MNKYKVGQRVRIKSKKELEKDPLVKYHRGRYIRKEEEDTIIQEMFKYFNSCQIIEETKYGFYLFKQGEREEFYSGINNYNWEDWMLEDPLQKMLKLIE